MVPRQSLPSDLLQRIDSAVTTNPHLFGQDVLCEHQQGTVTLQGKVHSYFQKQMAQEALRKLDGVERIVNLLEVSWDIPPRLQQPLEV